MSMPNTKELKKLVLTCHKLGIKTFKCAEYEFTLSEHNAPQTQKRVRKSKASKATEQEVEEKQSPEDEMISDEALLFWSSQGNEV